MECDGLTPRPLRKKKTYGEMIDEAFPQYLAIGVTPEQFWEGHTEYFKAYRKAWRLKSEHENQLAWLNGAYICEAIASCLGGKNRYPQKPHELQANRNDTSAETMQSRADEFREFAMQMNARRQTMKNGGEQNGKQ